MVTLENTEYTFKESQGKRLVSQDCHWEIPKMPVKKHKGNTRFLKIVYKVLIPFLSSAC